MEKIIYLRDIKNVPYAVVIATSSTIMGWAICSTKDQFNKRQARAIARERLSSTPRLPAPYHGLEMDRNVAKALIDIKFMRASLASNWKLWEKEDNLS